MPDVTVTINAAAIAALKTAMAKSLAQTADEMLSRERNAALMPMNTGAMQNEDTYVDDSEAAAGRVSIVTDAPQGRRLYFNPQYNFRHDHNANARGEWWETWISGSRKKEPAQIFGEFLRSNGSGVIT